MWPRLVALPLPSALTALTFVHAFRSIGATILVPGVAGAGIPRDFALALSYGDLATAALAVVTIVALRARSAAGVPLVVVTNVVGVLDLAHVFVLAAQNDIPHAPLGAIWYIPTFLVPILLIAHVIAFALLLRARR